MPENDNRFKRAARYNDAQSEDHGLHGVCAYLGIDVEELLHVSQQRALRLVLTESGRGAELSRITAGNRPTPVRLSDAEKRKINSATAAYMDGIALGFRAAKESATNAPVLSPEELEVLAEEHWNDGCALTIESPGLDAIPEDERETAQAVCCAVAEGGSPPFRLTLLTSGAGGVYKVYKEMLDD